MIGYNDNARDYIKRNLEASRYIRRNEELLATKKVRKLPSLSTVTMLVLIVSIIGFIVLNLPSALDTMWEQQYNHKE